MKPANKTVKDVKDPAPEMIQTVWVTFSDGTRACFSGRAVAYVGDTRTIRDIAFTEPKPLPPGCTFGPL